MKKILISTVIASVTFAAGLLPIENTLVVYNGGVGLVHEKSTLYLTSTDKEIVYRGVASTINTDSVNLNLPHDIKLYSQQYRYDKLTLHKLLDAHIDKKVYIKSKKATLLSHSGNFALIKRENGDIVNIDTKFLIFKSIPSSLLTKPTLIWNVNTKKNIETDIELDYLINNISWNSNYVLSLDNNRANLSGFITIDNRSGKDYKGTKLLVLAGEVNDAKEIKPNPRYRTVMAMGGSNVVKENSHGGYHLYSVPFKVDIAKDGKTQVKFLNIKNIKIKKTYVASLASPLSQRATTKYNVTQIVEITSLSEPLPKGVVRTYSKFKDTNILLGESRIKHTPKKTKIELKLGSDFDTEVISTLEDSSKTKETYIANIRYTISNNSNDAKSIKLHVPFSNVNDSQVNTSQKYKFIHANLVEFIIKLKANSSHTFNATFIQKR